MESQTIYVAIIISYCYYYYVPGSTVIYYYLVIPLHLSPHYFYYQVTFVCLSLVLCNQ